MTDTGERTFSVEELRAMARSLRKERSAKLVYASEMLEACANERASREESPCAHPQEAHVWGIDLDSDFVAVCSACGKVLISSCGQDRESYTDEQFRDSYDYPF